MHSWIPELCSLLSKTTPIDFSPEHNRRAPYVNVGSIREVKETYARFLSYTQDKSKTFAQFCSREVLKYLYDFERIQDTDILLIYNDYTKFQSITDDLLFRVLNRSIVPENMQEWIDAINSYCGRHKVPEEFLNAEGYHRGIFEIITHLLDDFVAIEKLLTADATATDIRNQPQEPFISWKIPTKISTLLMLFNGSSSSKNHLLLEQVITNAVLKTFKTCADLIDHLRDLNRAKCKSSQAIQKENNKYVLAEDGLSSLANYYYYYCLVTDKQKYIHFMYTREYTTSYC